MPKKDLVAVVDQSENFLTLQHYLIDSGIAAKLSDSKALIVYLVLKRFARWSGPRSCFPSIPTLAKLAFCSEMTVYRALDTLSKFDPQLVKIEKVTYKELKERGLLPSGYRATNVEINLYTILPIAPALEFPEESQPELKAKPESAPEQKKKPSEEEEFKGDLIGAWRKGKQSLYGKNAKVTNTEVKQIRRDLYNEFASLIPKDVLIAEIQRFWLPKKDMTDLERECVEKDRSVGALRWMLRRKLDEQAEKQAETREADRAAETTNKAIALAKKTIERNKLDDKIKQWVKEQLHPNAPVFGPARLITWLEKDCQLKHQGIEGLARKRIEKWGRARFDLLYEQSMAELYENNKPLWAQIMVARLPRKSIEEIAQGKHPAPERMREACRCILESKNSQPSQPQGAGGGES